MALWHYDSWYGRLITYLSSQHHTKKEKEVNIDHTASRT